MDDCQFGLYIRKLKQTTPVFNLIMTKMQFALWLLQCLLESNLIEQMM
jgi:hypothetical protein